MRLKDIPLLLFCLGLSHWDALPSRAAFVDGRPDEEWIALRELRETDFCAYLVRRFDEPAAQVFEGDRFYLEELSSYADGFRSWEAPEVYGYWDSNAATPPGSFVHQPTGRRTLAVENGDETIKAIRINYSDNRPARAAMLKSYENILARMPGVRLWIVHRATDLKELKDRLALMQRDIRKRITLVSIDFTDKNTFFEWARDGAVTFAASREGAGVLAPIFPGDTERPDYRLAIDRLAEAGLINGVQDSPFRMSAGNIITGSRHVFVGSNIVNGMMRDFGITRPAAVAALSAEFSKPVLEIGCPGRDDIMCQPAFDIDLTMVPVRDRVSGTEIVLLESPRGLFETLLGLPRLETLTPEMFRTQVLARISVLTKESPGPLTPNEKKFFSALSLVPYELLMIRVRQTDLIKNLLEQNDYEVRTLPGMSLLLSRLPGEDLDIFGGYPNSLLSGRFAIVPEVGISLLDSAAVAEYAALGYEVIQDPSVQELYLYSGGTRCASQVCRRVQVSRGEFTVPLPNARRSLDLSPSNQ